MCTQISRQPSEPVFFRYFPFLLSLLLLFGHFYGHISLHVTAWANSFSFFFWNPALFPQPVSCARSSSHRCSYEKIKKKGRLIPWARIACRWHRRTAGRRCILVLFLQRGFSHKTAATLRRSLQRRHKVNESIKAPHGQVPDNKKTPCSFGSFVACTCVPETTKC